MRLLSRSAAAAAAVFCVISTPLYAAEKAHESVLAIINAIRTNDVESWVRHTSTDEQFADMEKDWEEQRKKEPTDAERAEFAATMQTLTEDGAEEKLMADVRPALVEMRPQLPLLIGMAHSMALGAIDSAEEYDEDQRAAMRKSANALAAWATENDIASEELAGGAIGIATRTARGLRLNTLDDVKALEFDELWGKAGRVLVGVKDVFALYGLPIDPMLESATAKTISHEGDEAVVELSFDFLGTKHTVATKMKRDGDRWYSEQQLEALKPGAAGPAE